MGYGLTINLLFKFIHSRA